MEPKIIKNYPNYKITPEGTVVNSRGLQRRLKKSGKPGKEYYKINLNNPNGRRQFYVHRLVAKAFCKKPPGCNIVNHEDGNRLNNHYKNLKWATQSYNIQHAIRVLNHRGGKSMPGSKNPNCKLSSEDVAAIKLIYSQVKSYRKVASQFNVTFATIRNIVKEKSWQKNL